MSDTEQDVRMTVHEIALMRKIIAWCKANDIEFVRRSVLGTYWVDSYGTVGPWRRSVAVERDCDAPLGLCGGRYENYRWHEVESVTQAVDVLVAYGYLPARFSSAYLAGWNIGREDIEHPGPAGAEFCAIVPAVWP